MNISIIAAISKNNVIGKDNDLMWHFPKDMAFFKATTQNHWVIMGRKNYDSIPEKYRPLPNRTNVIVTRQSDFKAPNCIVVNSIEEALEQAKKAQQEEVFIIGGAQIYAETLRKNLATKLYLTHIDKAYDGDAFFPKIDFSQWKMVSEQHHHKDKKHEADFVIKSYSKE
ncbi:MAG: dihydrofolate reductase [Bacteroidia bacterium]